jgi:hypothetical protein
MKSELVITMTGIRTYDAQLVFRTNDRLTISILPTDSPQRFAAPEQTASSQPSVNAPSLILICGLGENTVSVGRPCAEVMVILRFNIYGKSCLRLMVVVFDTFPSQQLRLMRCSE